MLCTARTVTNQPSNMQATVAIKGKVKMGNPQSQPDFGEMPDLDDLLLLADIDGGDVIEAVQWLEDNAPKAAQKVVRE